MKEEDITTVEYNEGQNIRTLLLAMMFSTPILSRVAVKWDDKGLFVEDKHNLIGHWCVKHLKQYGECPGMAVLSRFRTWATSQRDENVYIYIHNLMGYVMKEGEDLRNEPLNTEFIVHLGETHFRKAKVKKFIQQVSDQMVLNKVDDAESLIAAFHRLDLGIEAGRDPIGNPLDMAEIFANEHTEAVVSYNGAASHFFADQLARDSFVSFLAPEGHGKSFWLLDVAYRALSQRRKVAYIDSGDMTYSQAGMRFACRLAQWPYHSDNGRWPVTIRIPKSIQFSGDESFPKSEEKVCDGPLDLARAEEARKEFLKGKIKSFRPYFRLLNAPNKTMSVIGIKDHLQKWQHEGFIPDILVCDYADILAPINGKKDERDQINETWMMLRSLSQERHLLVVTGTQANRKGREAGTIGLEHLSDDKRKAAHVTGMFSINQTKEQEQYEIQRLVWAKRRTGGMARKSVYVAGCRAIANPVMCSAFKPDKQEQGEDK